VEEIVRDLPNNRGWPIAFCLPPLPGKNQYVSTNGIYLKNVGFLLGTETARIDARRDGRSRAAILALSGIGYPRNGR
jgi:hypothetical protein